MEREELEQIPWSQLAVEADDGIDRRWYLVGIGVGLVVVAILGFRMLAGFGGQPDPVVAATSPPTVAATATVPEAPPIVTEEELRAADAEVDPVVGAIAEWFVVDLHTVDGSPETAASIRDRVGPALASDTLPHDDASAERTFVEWAKAYAMASTGDTVVVSVAYRRIRDVGGAFERDPVDAVSVELARGDGGWSVVAWPQPAEVP